MDELLREVQAEKEYILAPPKSPLTISDFHQPLPLSVFTF